MKIFLLQLCLLKCSLWMIHAQLPTCQPVSSLNKSGSPTLSERPDIFHLSIPSSERGHFVKALKNDSAPEKVLGFVFGLKKKPENGRSNLGLDLDLVQAKIDYR